jgi:hypothetical protein
MPRHRRFKTGVLEVALHTNGGILVFNGYTHEQLVTYFTPDELLARAHELAQGFARLPPLTSSYARIALTRTLRRIIDEGRRLQPRTGDYQRY